MSFLQEEKTETTDLAVCREFRRHKAGEPEPGAQEGGGGSEGSAARRAQAIARASRLAGDRQFQQNTGENRLPVRPKLQIKISWQVHVSLRYNFHTATLGKWIWCD